MSASAVRELFAQNSGEVFLPLLTLTHPQMTTIRCVNNYTAVTSRGMTFTAFPFQLDLPTDAAETLPMAKLTISNVDRMLIDEVRTLSGPMQARLEIVAASAPDSVEVGPFEFDVLSVSYNTQSITATLAYEPLLNEPFPAASFDLQRFPGLFGAA